MSDIVYFKNSQGRIVVLSNPDNDQYWELLGRYGFTAPEVDLYSQTFASGRTRYFGKTIKPRICGMNMIVTGKNRAERDKVFFEMLDVLLDVNGTGEGELHLNKSDGTPVVLHCVYNSGMRIAEEYQKFHRFTIEFYAADPFFYWEKRFDIAKDSGTGSVTVHNPFNENLWPEMKLVKNPAQAATATLANAATEDEISFVIVTSGGTVVTYADIDVYTRPEDRGIYGTKTYYDNSKYVTIHNAILDEMVGGDPDVLNFPLVPGDNVISWSYFLSSGELIMKKPFAGA